MTPNQVHYGQADDVYAARKHTLENAFHANPNRFVKKRPSPNHKPTTVWINPPQIKPRVQAQIIKPGVSKSLTRSVPRNGGR